MKPIKRVALLHSLCSVGKASLTNMIPVLSTMGVEACPIPTAILSTHTGGYGAPASREMTAEYIRACAEHYAQNNISFDMIFVGYLGSVQMASAVGYFLEQFPDAVVILDPIMGDHGRFYSNLNETYATAFLQLFPHADMVVPNLTEACLLTGTTYKQALTESEVQNICQKLHDIGVKDVILTSVSTQNGRKDIAYSSASSMEILSMAAEKLEFHGSGDVFDAVLIGSYLQKKTWKESILKAHEFVCACIRESSKYNYPEREVMLVEKNLSLLL